MFGKKGIAGTTVQDLARRAKCSQAAIYKYWEGKDALALELFEAANEELLAGMREGTGRWEDPSERALGALQGFVVHARTRPAEHAFLFQVFHGEYARWLVGRVKPSDLLREEIEAGMRAGAIPPADPSLKTALLLGMAIRVALFERQGLLVLPADRVDAELALAAAAVLGV